MATQPAYRLLTAEEFIRIDFGEQKAELERGVIRMMAGGTRRHARIQTNIIRALGNKLIGGPCAPYGPDMAVKTRSDSVRYPDVSVLCGSEAVDHDHEVLELSPIVLVEVLSPGTARSDLREKLEEYSDLASVDTLIFVDTVKERVRIVQRTGPMGWKDDDHEMPFDVPLPALKIALLHTEIFAR